MDICDGWDGNPFSLVSLFLFEKRIGRVERIERIGRIGRIRNTHTHTHTR